MAIRRKMIIFLALEILHLCCQGILLIRILGHFFKDVACNSRFSDALEKAVALFLET